MRYININWFLGAFFMFCLFIAIFILLQFTAIGELNIGSLANIVRQYGVNKIVISIYLLGYFFSICLIVLYMTRLFRFNKYAFFIMLAFFLVATFNAYLEIRKNGW